MKFHVNTVNTSRNESDRDLSGTKPCTHGGRSFGRKRYQMLDIGVLESGHVQSTVRDSAAAGALDHEEFDGIGPE